MFGKIVNKSLREFVVQRNAIKPSGKACVSYETHYTLAVHPSKYLCAAVDFIRKIDRIRASFESFVLKGIYDLFRYKSSL